MSAMRHGSTALSEKFMEATQFAGQKTDRPEPHYADILYEAPDDAGSVEGDYDGHVARSSVYTSARIHPVLGTAMLAGVGLAVAAGVRKLNAWRAD